MDPSSSFCKLYPVLPLLCEVEKLKMEDEEETVEGEVNDDTTEIIIGPKMFGGKF